MYANYLLPWVIMSEINTGGGGYVGSDANTRNFTGRDDLGNRVEINLDRNRDGGYQHPHPLSLAARVDEHDEAIRLIKQDLYGSEPSGILGVIKRLDKQYHQSQINMIISGATLLVVVVLAVAIVGLYWGP